VPEIRHQQPGASPEISLAEIHIPDDSDWGTGTFTTVLTPSALLSTKHISSLMLNAPHFQISVTINPNRNIPILIGKADGSDPMHRVTYVLPHGVDLREAKWLVVHFAGWRIMGASLDGAHLSTA
jgi:hypothetical protein